MADARKLARIHRVRTLQLTLKQADEARAHQRVASEMELSERIGQLAAAIAPAPSTAAGFSLTAAAFYRDRLQQSALAAEGRVRAATSVVDRAREATLEARRDQTAVEKLIDRAKAAAAVKEIRAMEDTPPATRNRHDPC